MYRSFFRFCIIITFLSCYSFIGFSGEIPSDYEESIEYVTKEDVLTFFEAHPLYNHFKTLLLKKPNTYMSYEQVAELFGLAISIMPSAESINEPLGKSYINPLFIVGIMPYVPEDFTTPIPNETWRMCCENYTLYLASDGALVTEESSFAESIPTDLGQVQLSSKSFYIDGIPYPLYFLEDTHYVCLEALNANTNCVHSGTVFSRNDSVNYGLLDIYSLAIDDHHLIPLRALNTLYHMTLKEDEITLISTSNTYESYLTLNNELLTNISEHPLSIDYTCYYWNGTDLIEKNYFFKDLPPNQALVLPKRIYLNKDASSIYITTTINQISFMQDEHLIEYTIHKSPEFYGQFSKVQLDALTTQLYPYNPKLLEDLFPEYNIYSRLKYDVGEFKKGELVEVWRAESGIEYKLIKEDRIISVPWDSVTIVSKNPLNLKMPTSSELEHYINSKNLKSETPYLVWTDLHRQRTYIFTKDKQKWVLYKNFICSTGKDTTPTPRGLFKLTSYVPAFGMNKGYMCKNAVGIFGDYLYHSTMFDVTGTYPLEGKGVLGRQASLGCIRFSEENSHWFYTHMPLKTTVWIN